MEYPPNVSGVIVVKPVNEIFADAFNYRNYLLTKQSARYHENIANELNKMMKKAAAQMRD